ncbi:MAG: hypothetical protein RLZZ15_2233 [Verrucomicrobiota bacterium]|jgi:transglutaminase-like putative cysteine protease
MNARLPRPQLSLDELHQLTWLLGGVLSLLAVGTVVYMEIEAWGTMGLAAAATLAGLVRPTLPARVPAWAHVLAFPLMVTWFLGDLWLSAQVLPAMVRLAMLLLLYRGMTYRQRRDDLQIIVLGLFLVVVAGVLTVSLVFAAQILIYTACALGFLLTITLKDAAGGGVAPAKRRAGDPPPTWAAHADWPRLLRRLRAVADRRVVALAAALFVGVVAVSGALFLLIPRFQIENSLFLDRFIAKKSKTGFSDSIRIGDVTTIQQDTSIALSVDVSDRSAVPLAPYWRMLVLDEYADGTFRLSPALRGATPADQRTSAGLAGGARPRLGAAVYWTFFLESGVSRYLPLPGEFENLRFVEPQNFRYLRELGVAELREEPSAMTAYRVDGVDATGVRPDPIFAKRWKENASPRRALQNRLSLTPADTATLKALAAEIAGEETTPAPEFARRAGAWLRARHNYSLSPVIPAGDGDPLVKWLASREAGHCELFAGSLVLLARAHGLPARVVTGFRGGSWNAYSNNFTVRNSDAHAWTEVFDAAAGAWRRADALETANAAQEEQAAGETAIARHSDASWKARWESLRVFWYRRIVSFDQRSQLETLRAVKAAAQNSGKALRAALERAAASVRAWLGGPWDVRRIAQVAGGVAALTGAAWLVARFRFSILDFRFRRGGGRADPVRREAGRWLARVTDGPDARGRADGVDGAGAAERDAVRADLERLRFGARATWAEPAGIFRRARRVVRAARR